MPVHDPDPSTFTSVGVDSTGKHTQANALPMGILSTNPLDKPVFLEVHFGPFS